MKTQTVRLVDVFLLGPFMVWAGTRLERDYPLAGLVMMLSGVATVGYNGVNYLRARELAS